MHCTLHYLAGGSYHDICVSAGLLTATFYRAVQHGIDAINSCPALQIKFPITLEDLTKAAQEFECHNSHGIMNGCGAALDGWLCWIHVPTADEVEKVKPYFSATISAMDLMCRPPVMLIASLHPCLCCVQVQHLTIKHFIPPMCII